MEEKDDLTFDAENYSKEDEAERSKEGQPLAFFKNHWLEIALGAGCCVLCIVCAKQYQIISMQKEALLAKDSVIAVKDKLIDCQADRITRLISRHEQKDTHMLKLAADALRHGSPEGGKALADWRDYLNGRYC